MLRAAILFLALTTWFSGVRGHADDRERTILDPAEGGIEYSIQGEFSGTDVERKNWGAQVIALGGKQFRLVGYPGGLPGDGYEIGDDLTYCDLSLDGDVAKGSFEGMQIVVGSKELKVIDPSGDTVASLRKIERKSMTLGMEPPPGAIVLFDGTTAEAFERGAMTAEGWLQADCETKERFGDHRLHVEFRTPFKPYARGQERGNSGVYVHGRYEVQVLDSFGLSGENNECGGIYSIAKPQVNMCYPPLSWQTYDIEFTAARYDENGDKIKNARITVKHNGVVIHDDIELPHGTPGKDPEGPTDGVLYLQGHGNPVVFKNIWVVRK